MDEGVRDPEWTRGLAIIGHPGAGATELTKALLAQDETVEVTQWEEEWGWEIY
jgi:peptide subunit release factor RF-3